MASPAAPLSNCAKCALFELAETSLPVGPSTVPADILENNNPPAEFNIPAIREFVARGSARRTCLDAKIASLRASLDALLQERNPLDAEIRKHEGALSPLRCMPTELLSLIFKYTLPPHTPGARSGPWVIGAVCSRWRTIVLSQPSLWSSIVLDFTELEDARTIDETQATLDAHLERSGNSPLNVTFIFSEDAMGAEYALWMLDTLADHCERWETLTISGPDTIYARLADIRGDLPLLRQMHVTIWPDGLEFDGPLDIFEVCPKLQDVSFIDYGTPVAAKLPFSQLLRFNATDSWTDHLTTLRSASNLVDCALYCTGPVSVPPGTVTLPHLRRLSLSESTKEVLDSLDVPALQELYYCDHPRELHSFLQRLPQLQKLVVTESPSAPDISRILHAAPRITTLGLHLHIDLASDLFSVFALPTQSGQPNRVPALESISIRFVRSIFRFDDKDAIPDLDQGLFLHMVESHWNHGSWRTVKLRCPKLELSSDTLERMEVLRGQGMQIVVFTDPDSHYQNLVPPDIRFHDRPAWLEF
ncbi:hypothetical protein C8R44DRAFT_790751 [Mycena epipterygia]|nr:hypothetical protein C8R44DRAFT_790751 [Mycena epipterygia]